MRAWASRQFQGGPRGGLDASKGLGLALTSTARLRGPFMHRSLQVPASAVWLRSWNIRGYDIQQYGKDPSVVLVAQDFECPDAWHQWLRLIEFVQPLHVLTSLASTHYYDPNEGVPRFQLSRETNQIDLDIFDSFGFPGQLVSLAHRVGFAIVGCNLSDAETRAASLAAAAKSRRYLYQGDYGLTRDDGELVSVTDLAEVHALTYGRLGDLITEYQALSDYPIVVGMCARDAMKLDAYGTLEGRGFGYVYVNQHSCEDNFKLHPQTTWPLWL